YLPQALKTFLDAVKTGLPTIFTPENGKQSFVPYPFTTIEGTEETFESPSLLLDQYYQEKATKDRINQIASDLLALIRNEMKKNETKIMRLSDDLLKSEEADDYRIKGELLTAYLYQIPKSAATVTLPNFYADEDLLEISLDPSLSASDNAQKYFTR